MSDFGGVDFNLEMEYEPSCTMCRRPFPDHLITSMYAEGGYTDPICPICAGEIMGGLSGVPKGMNPFSEGTIASDMWEQAQEIADEY